jgi:hypothetical protein
MQPNFLGYVNAPIKQAWPVRNGPIHWPPLLGLSDDRVIALAEWFVAQATSVPGW